jgi:hypothetical protein
MDLSNNIFARNSTYLWEGKLGSWGVPKLGAESSPTKHRYCCVASRGYGEVL